MRIFLLSSGGSCKATRTGATWLINAWYWRSFLRAPTSAMASKCLVMARWALESSASIFPCLALSISSSTKASMLVVLRLVVARTLLWLTLRLFCGRTEGQSRVDAHLGYLRHEVGDQFLDIKHVGVHIDDRRKHVVLFLGHRELLLEVHHLSFSGLDTLISHVFYLKLLF